MTIKRGGMAEPINGTLTKREIPAYCPNCAILHIQSKLGPRLYKEDDPQLIAGQLPSDHDQWLQCHNCGLLIARHDIPREGQLTTDVERITTKFHTLKEDSYKKPKHQRGFNERLDDKQDDGIKDPEVKRELKKGAKLISYSEK